MSDHGTPWEDPLLVDISSWPFRPAGEQLLMLLHRGDPLPSPRVRVTRYGTYMPKTYHAYRDSLRVVMKQSFQQTQRDVDENTRFGVKAVFFRRTQTRTDVDNLLKTLCDAGTGVIWKDDSQIVEQYGRVFLRSDDPRVVVLIYEVDEYPFEKARREHPCKRCGKTMTSANDWAKRSYCSPECARPRIQISCRQCGKPFTISPSIQARRPQNYCSRECAGRAMKEGRRTKVEAKVKKTCPDCGDVMPNQKATRCRPCYLKTKADSKSTPYRWVRPVDE